MPSTTPIVIVDLDGTLLHDAARFEDRDFTMRTQRAVDRLHNEGIPFAVATARPVSTGHDIVRRLRADACIYLNGALIDFDPAHSDIEMLTGRKPPRADTLLKVGFTSSRACDVCRAILDVIPDLEIGIVMDDVRYTTFDVSKYWTTQTWTYTDFRDVPGGTADKIIAFPRPDQTKSLASLIPDDFDVHVSEGRLWMLMAPDANKEQATRTLCRRWGADLFDVTAFGDDIVDIDMMRISGTGVAVANANPDVLKIADEVCPSNNDDGVAQWIEQKLL
ncbi:HAD hydrolase family protein [uncultured Bifidobacterium sp.]|uniref:HAD hydrolase family protein n=1 Tax=uncultured Bifidobacterium sp. TaxID=165187 RepID=UPI002590C227|nr:HAD hydrolase family protein [uncultured Bifidobacterium sp.]MEE0653654.1 HAD hydrolase family protein [Bifidobacterium criceti]